MLSTVLSWPQWHPTGSSSEFTQDLLPSYCRILIGARTGPCFTAKNSSQWVHRFHCQAQFSYLENVSVMRDRLLIWWHLNLNLVTSDVAKYSSPHGENVYVTGYRGPIGWQAVVGKYLSPQRENVSDNGYRGLIEWHLTGDNRESSVTQYTLVIWEFKSFILSPFVYYNLNTHVIMRVLTFLEDHICHFCHRQILNIFNPTTFKEDSSDTCCSRWETV